MPNHWENCIHDSHPLITVMILSHIMQSTHSHLNAVRSISILSHIYAYVFEAYFSFGFPHCRLSLFSHACHMPNPSHSTGFRYKSWRCLLQNVRYLPVTTSSLLVPIIFLSTHFSNTLGLSSSLDLKNQVSRPHRATSTIIALYILIFMFLSPTLED